MISLSLCMIVKNEEKNLDKCLSSTKDLFDEIIIIDTGSTDNTVKIAKKYTNIIKDFKWEDDFAKARNYSFSLATKEYIMWLDADDIILAEDLDKLRKLKNTLSTSIDIIMLKYNLNLDENNIPALSYYRERIIKNTLKYKWIGKVHEAITPTGNIIFEDIAITHNKNNTEYSNRNLKIFQKMIKNGDKFNARETFYYARELYYNKLYDKALKKYNEFLKMKDSWKENRISAYIDMHLIYLENNDLDNSLTMLLLSLKEDLPRAEICCHIANIFMQKKEYLISIYWYKQALSQKYDIKNGGFYIKDYSDFIPFLQLCVCYYNIADINKAIYYNNLAGNIKPTHPSYLNNKKLFSKK